MKSWNAVGVLLGRVRVWWHKQEVLGALDRKEAGRVAADLGTSINALNNLIARGPDAANFVFERMRALGISKADVDRAARGVMRDLQRTCACCDEKGVCEWDLAQRPNESVWKSYCPNAVTLDFLTTLKAPTSA